jgi:hypothetical protein
MDTGGVGCGPSGQKHLEQSGRQPRSLLPAVPQIHDRLEHQRRRWRTLFRRKALGDLFGSPYFQTD